MRKGANFPRMSGLGADFPLILNLLKDEGKISVILL